ncbi:ATP synthase subunit I [Pirellulaceae bacterium]|nr:ATP synthase subunit I [Pirellulaceae bacterium]
MTLIDAVMAFVAGLILGLLYFGGLLWTVQRLGKSKHPFVFYLTSFAARLSLVAACILFVLQVGSMHMLVAIAGFFVARVCLVCWTRYTQQTDQQSKAIR